MSMYTTIMQEGFKQTLLRQKYLEMIHSLEFALPLKAAASICSSPPSFIVYTELLGLYWQGRFSLLATKE